MAIKIIKRGGKTVQPADVVQARPKEKGRTDIAPDGHVEPKEMTDKERIAWWMAHTPPQGAKPRECAFCFKNYIMPCKDEGVAEGCQNRQFYLQHVARKEKAT